MAEVRFGILAKCPRCNKWVRLPKCTNCNGDKYNLSEGVNSRTGWFCSSCKLGDRRVRCPHCQCQIISSLFYTSLFHTFRNAEDGVV
jgi:hypothetical protein